MKGKVLSDSSLVGGEILYVGWSSLEIRLPDGRLVELNVVEGYSGPEFEVKEK